VSDAVIGESWSGEFSVPVDHPCLAGHFPGQPIVPAVLILDLSCELLCRLEPGLGSLREVRNAKFTRPVRPGETVRLSAGGAGGLLRLSCHTAEGLAVQAQLLFEAGS
jgi:3-hydroxymyristoyl/3-hydroxydecanoyl-(acyl carrier protein) dehydratase